MKALATVAVIGLSILAPVHRPHLICRGFVPPGSHVQACPGWHRIHR